MPATTKRRSRVIPDKLDEQLEITPSRRRMLELLHQHRYMTPRLVAFAYARDDGRNGRGFWHVRHELGELWRRGYVARRFWTRGPVGFGSPELVYTITPKGARAILDAEAYSAARHLIYQRVGDRRTNFEHHLALAELELIVTRGARGWSVSAFTTDERRARVRVKRARGADYGLQPDAWVLVEFPNGQRLLLLAEVDIERKNNARIDQRFEDYGTLLSVRLDDLKARYQVNNVVALFIEPTTGEAERLRRRAIEVLRREGYTRRPYFLFWNREGWFGEEQHTRRQRAPGGELRERAWVVRVLRDPSEILATSTVVGLSGKERRLLWSSAFTGPRVVVP